MIKTWWAWINWSSRQLVKKKSVRQHIILSPPQPPPRKDDEILSPTALSIQWRLSFTLENALRKTWLILDQSFLCFPKAVKRVVVDLAQGGPGSHGLPGQSGTVCQTNIPCKTITCQNNSLHITPPPPHKVEKTSVNSISKLSLWGQALEETFGNEEIKENVWASLKSTEDFCCRFYWPFSWFWRDFYIGQTYQRLLSS